jgi:hypothetical protein
MAVSVKKAKGRAQKAPAQVSGRPKNGQDAGRRSKAWLVRFVAGAALLAIAVYLRAKRAPAFYNITTSDYSANNLLRDVADAWPVIKSVGGKLLGAFAAEELLPAFAFLLPSVFFIAWGLSGIRKGGDNAFTFLRDRRRRTVILAVLFIVTLLSCLGVHFAAVGRYPAVGDEFCYLFGADHLASGRLYVDSPPMRDHFQTWSIINDGRWHSKVTVGWPLLLALGRPLRLEFLINPVLAALCVVLLFLIGESLLGAEGGLLAALWGLMTPFFIMMSGTYFPHTATALFSLLFIYFTLRAFETGRWIFPVLAGLSMAFLLLVRPGDAGVLFLGMTPLMAHQFVRSGEKKKAARTIAVIFALFAVGIGLLLWINKVQNGHALVFGYEKYHADDTWGFGANGHTPLKGLWNTAYSLMRIGAWGVPFVGLFLLASLFVEKWATRLLMVPVIGYAVLYAGFYSQAGFEFGPRYYIPMYLVAVIPAAGGALLVRDLLNKTRAPVAARFVAALFLSTAVFLAAGVWPRMLTAMKSQTAGLAEVSRVLDDPPVDSPSLIFLRDHSLLKNTFLTRNFWRYQGGKHVFVLYLMPEDNRKLMEMFPSRKSYMTAVEPATGKIEFVPYVDNAENLSNVLAAGLNYMEFDAHQAAGALAKALAMKPDDPAIMMGLARAQDTDGEKLEAAQLYDRVARSGDASLRDIAVFALATDLRELGHAREALSVYEELARAGQDPSIRSRASAWADKLSKQR